MHDLKRHNQKTKKVRGNKSLNVSKKINFRAILHRSLKIFVAVFSAILIVVGSFFVVQFMMASDLFRIDQVEVVGNTRLTTVQTIALSDIEYGVNTFHLDLNMIGHKIEENPWVEVASVQRIFPRKVLITVVEREPVAIINLGYLYYIDQQGEIFKVLDANDSLDYPVITGFDYEKAQAHDPKYVKKLKTIVSLIDELKGHQILNLNQVSEIHQNNEGGLTLFTLSGGVEIRLGWDGFANKISRLEKIYSKLQPKFNMLDYIDLNVDEKVIVRIERSLKTAKS